MGKPETQNCARDALPDVTESNPKAQRGFFVVMETTGGIASAPTQVLTALRKRKVLIKEIFSFSVWPELVLAASL